MSTTHTLIAIGEVTLLVCLSIFIYVTVRDGIRTYRDLDDD